jgi:hypothetical protein
MMGRGGENKYVNIPAQLQKNETVDSDNTY